MRSHSLSTAPLAPPSPTGSSYSADLSGRSQSIALGAGTGTCRRLSRKLPPSLTESLEMLATITTPSITKRGSLDSTNSTSSEVTPSQPTMGSAAEHGESLFPNKMYTLAVAPPTPTVGMELGKPYIPDLKPKASRKSVKKASISAPSGFTSPTNTASLLPPESTLVSRFSVSSSGSSPDDVLPPLTPSNSMPSLQKITSRNLQYQPRKSLFNASLFNHSRTPSRQTSRLNSPSQSTLPSTPTRYSPALRTDSPVPELSCSVGSATESSCGTSSFDSDRYMGISPLGKKEGRKARRARKEAESKRFDESTPPTMKELYEASLAEVIDEQGVRVSFGDLVRGKKTIVIFIRHWFCPLCAQYIKSILREVSPEALEEAGVELIIIGNGSAKMIDGYANKFFKSPFKTYTDPTLHLYRLLGLTRQTTAAGPDTEKGDYLTETPLETTVNTLKRATKMPLRNPGHFTQLGGEFIFDGTLNVTYTHRMVYTRDHAPIRDICLQAGVRLEFIHYEPGAPPPAVHAQSSEDLSGDDGVVVIDAGEEGVMDLDEWRAEKERTLDRIRGLREVRRMKSTETFTLNGEGGEVIGAEKYEEFGRLARSRYSYI